MDLSRLVERVVSPYEDARVELALAAPCALVGDRDQLTQVVTNLLQNALAEAKSRIRISTEDDGAWVRLVVEDDGPGIAEEDREAVFEPYFTKKDGGTGLGLAIVDRIVGDHGGSIELGASALGGARFVITLPVEGPPPEAAATFG
jgi:two-component system, NtrC family, nitrogen regulation sensor histidine kinase NtrY